MSFSQKLFQVGLFAYPREFRREYGPHMSQLFRDCHRDEQRKHGALGVASLWVRTAFDIARTAPAEQLDYLGRENSFMSNLRKDALALIGSIAIIVVAFLLLSYGRKREVSSILMFGSALDALVTTGIAGNLIVFLLASTTKLNPLRTALWTFLIINVALLAVAILIGSRLDPQFSIGKTVFGYAVSFLVWFGLHWIWAQRKTSVPSPT
jgi:hypothetical protein